MTDTRCLIGMLHKKKSLTTILCEENGDPSHTGTMLQACYGTPEKLDRLLGLGHIVCLGKIPEECTVHPTPKNDSIYHDRILNDITVERAHAQDISYIYLMDMRDGCKWKILDRSESYMLKDMPPLPKNMPVKKAGPNKKAITMEQIFDKIGKQNLHYTRTHHAEAYAYGKTYVVTGMHYNENGLFTGFELEEKED